MATLEDLDDLEHQTQPEPVQNPTEKPPTEEAKEDDLIDDEILRLSTADIVARRRLLEAELRLNKSEFQRLSHEKNNMQEKIKDNVEKIENNRWV